MKTILNINRILSTQSIKQSIKWSRLLWQHTFPLRITSPSLLYMTTPTNTKFPLMVELVDGKDFLVSAIPEGKDDFASYVEVLVSPSDSVLYEFFIQRIGILNISGTNEEIPDVGEKYDDTIYSLFVDREIHDQVLKGPNIAHKE